MTITKMTISGNYKMQDSERTLNSQIHFNNGEIVPTSVPAILALNKQLQYDLEQTDTLDQFYKGQVNISIVDEMDGTSTIPRTSELQISSSGDLRMLLEFVKHSAPSLADKQIVATQPKFCMNNRLQAGDDFNFDGLAIVNGFYRIRGRNDASIDRDFSAKLDVLHEVFFILKFESGFLTNYPRQFADFLDCVSTVIVKAKGFRNPGCRDWIDFDHNCGVRVDFLPFPSSFDVPGNIYYPITSVNDLQNMYEDLASLDNNDLRTTETQSVEPLTYYKQFMSMFSDFTTVNAQSINGWFEIRGGSHSELTHNLGYSANLEVRRRINIDLYNCTSSQKSCLQNEVSTAIFKANTFRNPECKDMVFFTGKVTIEYPAPNLPKVFNIVDRNSFLDFADFIQNHFPAIKQTSLYAPLMFKSTKIDEEPAQEVKQSKFYCPTIRNLLC